MKSNIKISTYVGISFLISFGVLILFLQFYSEGLLTNDRNITVDNNIFSQNPKHVTLDVLRSFFGGNKTDTININNLGFRGDNFFKIKPDNTYRIFMVGGSTLFGTGATSDDTTIPGYLKDFLKYDKYPYDIEVINAGIQGADSYNELELIKNRLIDLSPDLVIVYDGWNDLRAEYLPESISSNWNLMCKLGQQHNFNVIIIIQPIAGFSGKVLTETELEYLKNGKNYDNEPLINSLKQYNLYAKNLQQSENCRNGIDLKTVFDKELETIYSDQGHVLDKGNEIITKVIHKELAHIIPLNLSSDEYTNNESEKKIIQTGKYNKNEIEIKVQIMDLEDNILNHNQIEISTMNKTSNMTIPNVTYFLTISKDGNVLLRDYFFVENEFLILDVYPDNSENIKIDGNRQYDHNAFVVEKDSPIKISGPLLDSDGMYEFNMDLRTINNPFDWVFSLDDFSIEIPYNKN
jgi:lysophospholipase L1-like esterase